MASVRFNRGTREQVLATPLTNGLFSVETDQGDNNKLYADVPQQDGTIKRIIVAGKDEFEKLRNGDLNTLETNGDYSHAEGTGCIAVGVASHAEGHNTTAKGDYSHIEGAGAQTSGICSHAEGISTNTYESANYSHAEGYDTATKGIASHSEGYDTQANGDYSHVEGYNTTTNGSYSHAEGYLTDTGSNSMASHSEGRETHAIGNGSHAEGYKCYSNGMCSHAEGNDTYANGNYSHSEGVGTYAIGNGSHSEGHNTTANGNYSHAEGEDCIIEENAVCSHVEGIACKTSGIASHAEGASCVASGIASHAEGEYTEALDCQLAIGVYNDITKSTAYVQETKQGTIFVIGNGTEYEKSNAFRVVGDGKTYAKGAYNTSGADYAEYCEWIDGNVENENRYGYFVTDCGVNKDGKTAYVKKATSKDYIYGIVSANPSVIGNSDECWVNQFECDEWGNYILVDSKTTIKDENGKDVLVDCKTYKTNPQYDKEKQYIQRENRKEWDAIGMVGILTVRDDGTCVKGGFCCSNDEGIATSCERRQFDCFRVVDRISDNLIKVRI